MAEGLRETTVQVKIVPGVDQDALEKVKAQLSTIGKNVNFTVNIATSFAGGLGGAAGVAAGMSIIKTKVAEAARAAATTVPIKPQFDIGNFASQLSNLKSQYGQFVTGIQAQIPTGRALANVPQPQRLYGNVQVQKTVMAHGQPQYLLPAPPVVSPSTLAPAPGMPGGPPAIITPRQYFTRPGGGPQIGGQPIAPAPPGLPPGRIGGPPSARPSSVYDPYHQAGLAVEKQLDAAVLQRHILHLQRFGMEGGTDWKSRQAEKGFRERENLAREREDQEARYGRRRLERRQREFGDNYERISGGFSQPEVARMKFQAAQGERTLKLQEQRQQIGFQREFMQTPAFAQQMRQQVALRQEKQELAKEMRYAELTTEFGKLGGSIVYAEERFRQIGQTSGRVFLGGMGALAGLAAAGGPAVSGTFFGSLQLATGEITGVFLPTIMRVAYAAQQAATWLHGLSDETRKFLNTLAMRALIVSGAGMVGGRVLSAGAMAVRGMGALGMFGTAAGLAGGAGCASAFGLGASGMAMVGPSGWAAAAALAGLAVQAAHGGTGLQTLEQTLGILGKTVVQVVDAFSPLLVAIGNQTEGVLKGVNAVLRMSEQASNFEQALIRMIPNIPGIPGAGTQAGQVAQVGINNVGALAPSSLNQLALVGNFFNLLFPPEKLGTLTGIASQKKPPLISTGFVSQQGALEDFHSFVQQQAVRDPIEQAKFEQQMQLMRDEIVILNQIATNTGSAPPAPVPTAPAGPG